MRERRYKAVSIADETLCEILRPGGGELVAWVEGLPATAEIERIVYRDDRLSLVAIFYDESFDIVPLGFIIPHADLSFRLRKFDASGKCLLPHAGDEPHVD
jgi:hypothetical protein